ncbi:MAG: prephenate dehydratase [Abitibacteriaceae bacterium]|nr:prephenate dehydratase [Abditibacteriaceae bacterium]MBV9866441.1 prephenate dehydratase [Abditibacteriaceae bacterium]
MSQENLAAERERIDAIDTEILRLLNQRVESAVRVGHIKEAMGLPLHDPSRERIIYERLRDINTQAQGRLPAVAVTAIYREIISACRNAEHPTKVAFLGPSGTNTQEAAVQYFGSAFIALPCGTPDEVCAVVARSARSSNTDKEGADYGVLAIENSIQGIVSANLDLLANSPVTISAEIELAIHHCLLSNTELGRITTIYSHEHALGQCRNWLTNHLPGATLVPVTSTARGAEMATQEPGAAAISSAIAANIYGLQIVASNIEDLSNNKTRFFVIAAEPPPTPPSGRDKTSLAFQVPHKPGALVEVLNVFQRHGINLSMIQSRPSRQQAWEYRFFADLQAHRDDPSLKAALKELQDHTVSVKIMGSYPEANS